MVDENTELDNDSVPDADVAQAVAYITQAHEARKAYPTTPQYRPVAPQGQGPVPTPRLGGTTDATNAIPSRLVEGEGFLWRLSAIAGGRGGRAFLDDDINRAVSCALMSAEDMSSTDPDAAEREVREILLNARDERERMARHGAGGAPKTSRATTGRTSRVERDDVRATAAKLDNDPRICFKIIKWMAGPGTYDPMDPPQWYIPLCVEHNLHPDTGARLTKWKGKVECIQRLHDAGVTWADPHDVYTAFGVYKSRKAEGTRLLWEAKAETLRIKELRQQLWVVLDDPDPDFQALLQPDANEIISAIEDRWPPIFGL